MSIPEAENFDIFTFWGYLHDAWIYNCNQTQSGQEYLENAYYYSLKTPDKSTLKQLFGGGKNVK